MERSDASERARRRSVEELFEEVVLDLREPGTTQDRTGEGRRLDPAPDALEAAVRFAASWLRYFSFAGIGRGDAPGTVVADRGVARCVVFEPRPAGRRIVHEVHGEAAGTGRHPIVFCRTGFTEQAVKWSDENPVALFRMDPNGDITPENTIARRLLEGSDERHLG